MNDSPERELDPYPLIEELEERVKVLTKALIKETTCGTCNGQGRWTPECYACLSGEPDHCTCALQDEETCPQCNGKGTDYRSVEARSILEPHEISAATSAASAGVGRNEASVPAADPVGMPAHNG